MSGVRACPICGGGDLQEFYHVAGMPVLQNQPVPTVEEARACVRGDIALAVCRRCGFVFNAAFDPERIRYTPGYENTQACSPVFQGYMEDLADRLIAAHGLRHKTILEIGCGKGEFLALLCERGPNRGIGFDPSVPGGGGVFGRVTLIADVYSERYAAYQGDFVCSRHVLEHLSDPGALLATLRRSIGDRRDVAVYVEVPNTLWILRHATVWDVFYEHCSYFGPDSIRRLLESRGFAVAAVNEQAGGQYLGVHAAPSPSSAWAPASNGDGGAETMSLAVQFRDRVQHRLDDVRSVLESLRASRRSAAVWGAGAKGVTLLNLLRVDPEAVPYVVDINPKKQGKYVPGTGQRIVSPAEAAARGVDAVFVMNPNYHAEIRGMAGKAGLAVELIDL
jgi:SAM-dependent methyltransferase